MPRPPSSRSPRTRRSGRTVSRCRGVKMSSKTRSENTWPSTWTLAEVCRSSTRIAILLRRALGARLSRIAIRVDDRHTSASRSEEHTSELQSRLQLVCRLLLEKKKSYNRMPFPQRKNQIAKTKHGTPFDRHNRNRTRPKYVFTHLT